MPRTVIVVPCYNEELRFKEHLFREYLSQEANVLLIFVDDGSTDGTLQTLRRFAAEFHERTSVLHFPANRGKAESVRAGLLQALEHTEARYVGFWDADLATPLWTIETFRHLLDRRPEITMVFGARVKLLGRTVHRQMMRHYLGRLFATAASMCLRLSVYDTQCGAKLFRRTPALAGALAEPFLSRWIFDVELLARLIQIRGPEIETEIVEYPLETWADVAGSKVKPRDFIRAAIELAQIWLRNTGHRYSRNVYIPDCSRQPRVG